MRAPFTEYQRPLHFQLPIASHKEQQHKYHWDASDSGGSLELQAKSMVILN